MSPSVAAYSLSARVLRQECHPISLGMEDFLFWPSRAVPPAWSHTRYDSPCSLPEGFKDEIRGYSFQAPRKIPETADAHAEILFIQLDEHGWLAVCSEYF